MAATDANSSGAGWEAATFAGSRRAMILRARERTIYERLETMVELTHSADELARLGRRWRREPHRRIRPAPE
ncbi:MAG: hypothetical protein ACLFPV_16215 [Spirochaetaceae bacterium]